MLWAERHPDAAGSAQARGTGGPEWGGGRRNRGWGPTRRPAPTLGGTRPSGPGPRCGAGTRPGVPLGRGVPTARCALLADIGRTCPRVGRHNREERRASTRPEATAGPPSCCPDDRPPPQARARPQELDEGHARSMTVRVGNRAKWTRPPRANDYLRIGHGNLNAGCPQPEGCRGLRRHSIGQVSPCSSPLQRPRWALALAPSGRLHRAGVQGTREPRTMGPRWATDLSTYALRVREVLDGTREGRASRRRFLPGGARDRRPPGVHRNVGRQGERSNPSPRGVRIRGSPTETLRGTSDRRGPPEGDHLSHRCQRCGAHVRLGEGGPEPLSSGEDRRRGQDRPVIAIRPLGPRTGPMSRTSRAIRLFPSALAASLRDRPAPTQRRQLEVP